MRWSRFTCVEEFHGVPYLVNTLTRAVATISPDLKRNLEMNSFVPCNEEERNILQKMKEDSFVVDDDFDEMALFRYYVNKLKYTTNDAGIDATVLLTYKCNLSCIYCYETGVKEKKETSLDEEKCNSIIQWLDAFAARKKTNEIFVDFYGGEPFLNLPMMKYFMRRVRKNGKSKYRFSAVTNGTILTKRIVDELKPLGFCATQITLDGVRGIHDERRPFMNGKGTFDIIFSNLLNIVDEIGVGLSINTDKHNWRHVQDLLDLLDQHGLKNKVVIAFNIIQRAPKEQRHCTEYIFSDAELSASQVELYEYAVNKGFCVETSITSGVCRTQHEFSIVIDPVGDIFPCPATVGIDAFCAGNVNHSFGRFYRKWSQFVGAENWDNEICVQCSYLPICLGGCRHRMYTALGKTKGRFCQWESYGGDVKIMIARALQESRLGGINENRMFQA